MNHHIFYLLFACILAHPLGLFGITRWDECKIETMRQASSLPGWCSPGKTLVIMETIKKNNCQNCIEIGVFAGKSLLPMAKAVEFIGKGKVYAIDAWTPQAALEGLALSDPNYSWWKQIDFDAFHHQTIDLIQKNNLSHICSIRKESSQSAAGLFVDETIDFIHIDGNHSEEAVFQNVVKYFPKLKDRGYLLLADPNWISSRKALVYLLERADTQSPFSSSASFLLFRKNKQRIEQAEALTNH